MDRLAELSLPEDILALATINGMECLWPVDCIPEVIEAMRDADLVNMGGHLQFRLKGCGICECYWIDVDTHQARSTVLPWRECVDRTADIAFARYSSLRSAYDFLQEGQRVFSWLFADYERLGRDPADAMYFVWHAASEVTQSRLPSPRFWQTERSDG